jgi:hypothetical protein
LGADRRNHEIDEGDRREQQPAVLADRKDRLVGGVARLELADLAINHQFARKKESFNAEDAKDTRRAQRKWRALFAFASSASPLRPLR